MNLIPGLNKGRDGWDIQCISEQAEELVLQGTGLEQQDIHHRVSERCFLLLVKSLSGSTTNREEEASMD